MSADRSKKPQSTPGNATPLPAGNVKADHSMKQEEPLGWDQAPVGQDSDVLPQAHRHPRQEGKGGTPDAKDGPKDDRATSERPEPNARQKK